MKEKKNYRTIFFVFAIHQWVFVCACVMFSRLATFYGPTMRPTQVQSVFLRQAHQGFFFYLRILFLFLSSLSLSRSFLFFHLTVFLRIKKKTLMVIDSCFVAFFCTAKILNKKKIIKHFKHWGDQNKNKNKINCSARQQFIDIRKRTTWWWGDSLATVSACLQ